MTMRRLTWESTFWKTGTRVVAGVDEVGRGALAGPLVAAAVALDPAGLTNRKRRGALVNQVKDSKLLSPKRRVVAFATIHECALAVAIGVVNCAEIDELGMAAANRIAMERAVLAMYPQPDLLVLDAFVTDLDYPQVGLIDGDDRCLSVSAASIIAKVTRDRMMERFDQIDRRFGFAQHCGYGTPEHLAAIRKYGPCELHRKSFRPIWSILEG